LGVSKEESDALMDGMVVDPLAPVSASAETEDDPAVSAEPTVPPEKVKKSKQKEKPAEPLEPAEESTEGEEEESEAPSEPIAKPVKAPKDKANNKVTKTIIPLAKIWPPGIDEADTDADGTVSAEEAEEQV
jgi:hypothetical protein